MGVGLSGIVVKVIADCPGTSWIYVNRNITRKSNKESGVAATIERASISVR